MKKVIEPKNAAFPLPVVLVTCCDNKGNDNIITIAWTTNVCRKIPHLGIVINGEKYSSKLIKETREFVVNIPNAEILKEVDFCGENKGDQIDKFDQTKLTKTDSLIIKPKIIKECPINIECKLKDIYTIESSNLFIGEIVKTHIEEDIIDGEGKINYQKLNPIIYAEKKYYSIRESIGYRGFSKK